MSDEATEDHLLQLVMSQGLEEDSLGGLFEQTAEELTAGIEVTDKP